jgi:hypothetical protein
MVDLDPTLWVILQFSFESEAEEDKEKDRPASLARQEDWVTSRNEMVTRDSEAIREMSHGLPPPWYQSLILWESDFRSLTCPRNRRRCVAVQGHLEMQKCACILRSQMDRKISS